MAKQKITIEPEVTPTLPVAVEVVTTPRRLVIRGSSNDFPRLEQDALDDGWRPVSQSRIVQSAPEIIFEREFSH